MYNKNKQTFTFMEMIAIIVIIIVLITLIMPAVIKSREWGKSIKCRSNMKTIADGVFSYTSDMQGVLPMVPVVGWSGISWSFLLKNQGYLPAPKHFIYTWTGNLSSGNFLGYPADYDTIWACPSELLAPQNRFLSQAVYGIPNYKQAYDYQKGWFWGQTHYALNRGLSFSSYKNLSQFGKRLRGLSYIGLLIDSPGGPNCDFTSCFNGVWNHYANGQIGLNLIWARHWGRAPGITSTNYQNSTYMELGSPQVNTIFLDGHSEAWNNMNFWNKFVTPNGSNKTPFSTLP